MRAGACIKLNCFFITMRHLVDIERAKSVKFVQEEVRIRTRGRFHVWIGDKSKVLKKTIPSPMGPTTIYALKDTVDALGDPDICEHCKYGENIEAYYGLVTKAFCNSCRVVLSKKHRCKCERFLWVTAVGIPAPLCKECSK